MPWDFAHPFTFALCPVAADMDGLAHTNNAVYVRWCEQIAWAHSEALGLALADYQRLDRAMAIRHGQYDYLLATYEGDALILGTWLLQPENRQGMRRAFQLLRATDQATVLRGYWDLLCIEISTGKPRRWPVEFEACYRPAMRPLPP